MPGTVQSIERAAAVLRLLAAAPNELGVADLGNALGLAKTTVHGILRTLHQVGFVEQDHTGAHYHLSDAFGRLGESYLDPNELRSRAINWADSLASRSGEVVRIGRLVEGKVVVVHHVFRPDDTTRPRHRYDAPAACDRARQGRAGVRHQRRRPAAQAGGVHDPDDHRPGPAGRRTGRGPGQGWASEFEEYTVELAGIAAPIRGLGGLVVGAIGITGRVERICDSRLRHRADLVSMVRAPRRPSVVTSGRTLTGGPSRSRRTGRRVIGGWTDGRAIRGRGGPGHDLDAVHPLRSAPAARLGGPAGAPPALPRPGWVEHDAGEIWRNVSRVVPAALRQSAPRRPQIVAIGIANQRETTVLWDRHTGRPIGRAVTWQDTRTDRLVTDLAGAEGPDRFADLCGLPLATLLRRAADRWLLDHTPGLRRRAERGEVLFGTMESWLIWNLTGGARWTARHRRDQRQPHHADGPRDARLGRRAAAGVRRPARDAAGDPPVVRGLRRPRPRCCRGCRSARRSATSRPRCSGRPASAPARRSAPTAPARSCCSTPGGDVRSEHGLLTTVAYQIGDHPASYALEGSIAVTGSLVQWFRDKLGMIHTAAEIETLARTVEDNGGCYIVPAFSGLFAPHWRSEARGVIAGLTGYITKGHLARAVLEATALADPRGRRRDERRLRGRADRAEGRRRDDGQQPADAVPSPTCSTYRWSARW